MTDVLGHRPKAPAWLLWGEILLIAGLLVGLGVARFSRVTEDEVRAIELEAGLLRLHEMQVSHHERHGEYFAPDDPHYRAYLPWMDRYACDVRYRAGSYSVVVHADLDGDGEVGSWRIGSEIGRVEWVVGD